MSLRTNSGLIELFEYSSPTDPIPNQLMAERIQQGSSGTPITLREYEYTSRTAQGTTIYPISKLIVYPNDNGTGALETTFSYLWHSSTNRIQQRTTTFPAVPGSQNGSNVAATLTEQFDTYGNLLWRRDERGVITRQEFDAALGVVTRLVQDVDTSIETGVPLGWSTVSGFGLNLITDFEHDNLGRQTRSLCPEHSIAIAGVPTQIRTAQWMAYWVDSFGKEIRTGQGYFKVSGSTETLINPVSILKESHQGTLLEEIQAVQGWPIGSSSPPEEVAGPVSPDENAFPQESYVHWTTYQYANCCQLVSSRRYHAIPDFGTGSEGTHYDQTRFSYDTMGRRNRVQSPGGTITFTVYDARSQELETWIGTNDDGATEDDPTGGGFEPENDMVILSANQYDNGLVGRDGNLTQVTQYVSDSVTRVTSYLYDFRNRQTAIDGEIDFYQITTFDNLDRATLVERRNTSSGGTLLSRNETKYDNRGRPFQAIVHGVDPTSGSITGSQVRDFTYDQGANLIRQEPAGAMNFLEFDYDGLGRRTEERKPLGITTQYTFDNGGNLTATTDPMNETWTQGFDGIGRLVRSSNPLNQSAIYGFNYAGYQTTVTNPLSETTATNFDAAGRVTSIADPLNEVTTFTYDPEDNRTSVTDPNNLTTEYEYNERNWLVKVTDPAGHEVSYEYNRVGEKTKETDAKGHDTTFAFDALGRKTSITDRLNYTTTFAWNALGLQASLTDAQSQTTSYEYDPYQRLYRTIWPDHTPSTAPGDANYGITQIEYDSLNRILLTTDQLGDTITHSYDAAGRLLTKDYRTRVNSPSGTISDSDTFTYNANSQILTAVCGRYNNTVTRTYDAANRKSSESLTISGKTYTSVTQYNAAGRVSKLIYPDASEVTRTYTARGELSTISLNATTIDTRTYDDGGRLTSSSYNNGVSEARTYNLDSTLASISFTGAAIGNLGYTWDANHNKTSETISGVMSGYGFTAGYDDEDRLTSWDRADTNLDQAWNLSAVGNWNSFTENASTQVRTHSAANEILTAASQNVLHDPKGNVTLLPTSLTTHPSPLAMKWDFNNKLHAADTDNDSVDDVFFLWDALGRRVGRTDSSSTTIYFQDGEQTLADYIAGANANAPIYNYVWGSYIDELVLRTSSSGNLYYHRTQQYSINAVTTSAGAVAERYAYTAYGQPTILNASATPIASSAIGNRYMYTGREWDATLGLYHYRARWMSGIAGRFLGRDPIGYHGTSNLMIFAKGNPLTLLDPTGLQTIEPLFPENQNPPPPFEPLFPQWPSPSPPPPRAPLFPRDRLPLSEEDLRFSDPARVIFDPRWPLIDPRTGTEIPTDFRNIDESKLPVVEVFKNVFCKELEEIRDRLKEMRESIKDQLKDNFPLRRRPSVTSPNPTRSIPWLPKKEDADYDVKLKKDEIIFIIEIRF